jgi:hypothetical protein
MMTQSGNSRQGDKKSLKENAGKDKDDIQSVNGNSEESPDIEKKSPEALAVTEEITELLSKEDIVLAVQKFKADSEEKKIAMEFANSHINFLKQVVESDYNKKIARSDVEIRDMLSHVNSMLMKKDEYLFSTIITHSPSHYRTIQKRFYAKIKKEEENK